MKRGALNISFAWLFAIIVGAFVLFLAIYISIKVVGIGQTQTDVTASKEIGILLNPLETGIESSKTPIPLILPAETRIYNGCNNEGNFGEQSIKVSQQSFNKWSDTDVNSIFYNKYIFSDSIAEGKKFYLFSMPFDYPFKVSDLIFLTSKEYCFVDAPSNVEKELPIQENLKFENCSINSIKVCFNKNCDINVNYNLGYVDKSSLYERDFGEKTEDNTRLYFTGNLMYAAIFSDSEVYNCQTKRLMQRTEQLCSLYTDKINFMKNRCQSDLDVDLLLLKNSAKNFENSDNFVAIDPIVNSIKQQNENSECSLW